MKKHYRHENDCANCGADLQGKYCHNCGQENLELRENFGHMMSHAINDYFHFDHQFFHTVKPLFFQPGKLTIEYMAGRRVQYLHPVKMYIFISLVFFLLFFKSNHEVVKVKSDKATVKQEQAAINQKIDSVLKDKDVPQYIKPIIRAGKSPDQANDTVTNHNEDAAADGELFEKGRFPGASKESSYEAYLAKQQALPIAERDGMFLSAYNKKSFNYQAKYDKEAREMFYEDIKHNIPKMMFLLLPICALIFKIAWSKNRKYYVEHLIFTFHLHCFIFAFLAMLMLLQMIIPNAWGLDGWFDLAALIGICWYLYRSLRVFYQRSRWRTISKMIGAGTMYFVAFGLCMFVLFAITAVV